MPISPPNRSCPTWRRPRRSFPGNRLFFASAIPIDGYACGVLVKSHMGRPINLEGNPAHPASLGAVDIFGQADDLDALRSRPLAVGDAQRAGRHLGALSDVGSLRSAKNCCKRRVPACAS